MLPYVCVRTMFEPTNKYSSRRNISIQVVELRYGGLFIPLLLFCFFFRPSVVAPFCCVWTIASQHTKTKNTIQKKRLKENRKAIGKKEKKKKNGIQALYRYRLGFKHNNNNRSDYLLLPTMVDENNRLTERARTEKEEIKDQLVAEC